VYFIRKFFPSQQQLDLAAYLEKAVSHSSSLSASSALVPHLSNRRWIHFLPNLKTSAGSYVDCVVWDPSVNNTPLSTDEAQSLRKILSQDYVLKKRVGALEIWQFKISEQECIRQEENSKLSLLRKPETIYE
jgi:hypothetical protein